MARKKKEKVLTAGGSTGTLGSLGDLLGARGYVSSERDPSTPPVDPAFSEPVSLDLSQQTGVRIVRETKGRRGKIVTLLRGLRLSDAALQELSRRMRKSFGCGSSIDRGEIVLQGDMVDRATRWLKTNGLPG